MNNKRIPQPRIRNDGLIDGRSRFAKRERAVAALAKDHKNGVLLDWEVPENGTRAVPRKTGNDWIKVVWSADCNEDGDCPNCGIDYAECPCPGPTQDGYEYEEREDGLYARWIGDAD